MALFKHTVSGSFGGGEVWTFTLHTEGNLSVAAANSALVTGITNMFGSAYGDVLPTSTTADSCSTVELDPATGKQTTGSDATLTLAGTNAGQSLPYQCATVVSLLTNQRNRSGRGRFYTPSPAVDQVTDGHLSATAAANTLAGAGALIDGLTAASLTPVLYSRTTKATTVVQELRVGDVVDTQRRRRNKLVETYVSSPV